MTLKEMAAEYRETAGHIRERIREQEQRIRTGRMCETKKARERAKLAMMWTMFREMRATAACLERYYERS